MIGAPARLYRRFSTLFAWAGASVVTIGLSFLINVLVARAYSVPEVGAYFLALLVMQFMTVAAATASNSNALKVLTELPEAERTGGAAALLRAAAGLAALWLAAALAGLAVLAAFAPDLAAPVIAGGLTAGAAQAVFTAAQNAQLTGGRKRQVAGALAGAETVRLVLSVAAVAAGLGVEWQLYAVAASRLAVVGWIMSRVPALLRAPSSPLPLRRVVTDGLHLQGAQVAAIAAVRLFDGAVVIGRGVAELGLFGVAAQIPGQLQRVFEWFRPLLTQVLVETESLRGEGAVRLGGLLALAAAAAAAPLALFAPEIVSLVYGAKYMDAAPAFALMAVAAVGTLLSFFFSIVLVADGKPRQVVFGPTALGIVGAGACLLLVGPYGASGAAVALLLGQAASATANTVSLLGAARALAVTTLLRLWWPTAALAGAVALLAYGGDSLILRAGAAAALAAAFLLVAWRARGAAGPVLAAVREPH